MSFSPFCSRILLILYILLVNFQHLSSSRKTQSSSTRNKTLPFPPQLVNFLTWLPSCPKGRELDQATPRVPKFSLHWASWTSAHPVSHSPTTSQQGTSHPTVGLIFLICCKLINGCEGQTEIWRSQIVCSFSKFLLSIPETKWALNN